MGLEPGMRKVEIIGFFFFYCIVPNGPLPSFPISSIQHNNEILSEYISNCSMHCYNNYKISLSFGCLFGLDTHLLHRGHHKHFALDIQRWNGHTALSLVRILHQVLISLPLHILILALVDCTYHGYLECTRCAASLQHPYQSRLALCSSAALASASGLGLFSTTLTTIARHPRLTSNRIREASMIIVCPHHHCTVMSWNICYLLYHQYHRAHVEHGMVHQSYFFIQDWIPLDDDYIPLPDTTSFHQMPSFQILMDTTLLKKTALPHIFPRQPPFSIQHHLEHL